MLSVFELPVRTLALALKERGWRLSTAESCTGGLMAAACTSIAGSSEWFERGFVTYSNQAKSEMLGVATALIQRYGAVSREVACAMAEGVLKYAPVEISVAITGIAGPAGDADGMGKPIGLVWLACAKRGELAIGQKIQIDGDRATVRLQSVEQALRLAHAQCGDG